jgi:lipoyl(octanoyl) transferase
MLKVRPMPLDPIAVLRLGRVGYADAFALQQTLVDARVAGDTEDLLLLLEHPPTITHSHTGRGLENLLGGAQALSARGVVVETTDRGGDITFHGPGQLVGYPIVALSADRGERDLHLYLRRLEQVLMGIADRFGVATVRVPGRTGTWLLDGSRKLAAIGVKVRRWTTLHGFAINVSTDLSYFDLIVPCGIPDAGVTSLARELGAAPSLDDVMDVAASEFAEVFERRLSPPSEAVRILLRTWAAAASEG